MIKHSIARRYAQALIELVEDDAAATGEKLQAFARLLEDNPVFREVLTSPAFRMEERRKVFEPVMAKLGWGPPLDRFLWYLIEHGRLEAIDDIAGVFTGMVDERAGRVRVEVVSASPLDETSRAALLEALAEGLGGQVVLESRVDESLLAGLSVRIGDLVVDGSLKTQLDTLREHLIQRQA